MARRYSKRHSKKGNAAISVFKTLFIIAYIVLTAYLAYGYADILMSGGENVAASMAVYLVFAVLIIGLIGYAVCAAISLIGLIIAAANDKPKGFFVVGILLSVLTELVFIVLCGGI
ncbi:MAG: hypothetical protein J6D30_01650 [Clostridia bacterium]|nr:hypothetical protein [Clostridia bacterium]